MMPEPSNLSREASNMSNNEVLIQLKNLKKHLHKEQMQVENDLNNSNNRTNVGQLTDIRHRILNIETPPGDRGDGFYSAINKEPALLRRDEFNQKTYRKELESRFRFLVVGLSLELSRHVDLRLKSRKVESKTI